MKKHNKIITRTITLAALFVCTSGLSAAPDYEKMFNRIDADNSGSISLEELTNTREAWVKGESKKKGWDAQEVEDRLAKAGKNAKKDIKKADADGDGELSLDEYIKMRQK